MNMRREGLHPDIKKDIVLVCATFLPYFLIILQGITLGLGFLSFDQSRSINILISALLMAFAMVYVLKRNLKLTICSYLIVTLIVLLNLIFFPNNASYLYEGFFYLFFINLPSFLCIASVRNVPTLFKSLKVFSYVVLTLAALYVFLILTGRIYIDQYDMSFSYTLLLPSLFFIHQKNVISSILFVIVAMMMLLMGSRGAFLISFGYLLVVNNFFMQKKRIPQLMFIGLPIVLLASNVEAVLKFAQKHLHGSSRTLMMLIDGSALTHDSGRDGIFELVWKTILDNPIVGKGIYHDRLLLKDVPGGSYAHNIFLEVLLSFGFLFGGIMLVGIAYLFMKLYSKANSYDRETLLFFLFLTILPLMVSGSFLWNVWFALFLGSLGMIRKNQSLLELKVNS